MYYHEEMLPLALLAQALGMYETPQISIVEMPNYNYPPQLVKISSPQMDPRLNLLATKHLMDDELLNRIQTKMSPHTIDIRESAVGPGKKRLSRLIASERSTPTSQSSFSESRENITKVASATDNDLSNLQYDVETIDKWGSILKTPSMILNVTPNNLPMVSPPQNNSEQVKQELQDIVDVMSTKPLSNAITKKIDEDLLSIFFEICTKANVDPMEEDAFFISKDLLKISIYLKYKFLRPRPSEIAPYYGFKLNSDINLDGTNDSPSYPSNQSLQGYALAKFYSDIYPNLKERFYQAADAIALSRLQRGDHFPSDNAYSKLIAEAVMGPADPGTKPTPQKARVDTSKDLLTSSVKSTPFSMATPIRSQEMDFIEKEVDKNIQKEKVASTMSFKKFKHLDKLFGR